MTLDEALRRGPEVATEWWRRWYDRNPDGTPAVAELTLPRELRALSRRVRAETFGPPDWVTES